MAQYYTAGQALPPVGSAAYVSAQQGSGAAPIYNPQNTAQSQPAVSPMSANTFTQNTPAVVIPLQPTYSNPGVINAAGLANATQGMAVGADGKLTYTPPEVATAGTEQQGRASNLMTMLGLAPKKENVLSSPEVVNQQAIVQQQRQTLNDYTSQLNNVIAKQNQDLLSTRASVSAEGGTEAVYGGIAATINREAAIRALPLQAAVAAAQGNLQLAQEYLTQVTALKTEQVANDYAYKTLQYQAISSFVTNEQNIRLDELKTKAAQEFDLKKMSIQNEYEVGLQKLKDQATGNSLPTINGKPLTDTQTSALGYAQRMADANSILTDLGSKFTGFVNNLTQYLPNQLKSADRQSYEQAQRNFVNAVLRKESGAAISPSEFDSAARQYFPQPGDSAAVVAQKTQNRNRVIANLAQSANTPLESIVGTKSGGSYEDYLKAIGQ